MNVRIGLPTSLALSALLVSSLAAPSSGQLAPGGRTALEAARGGAVRSRAPGNMVSAGVAAAITFSDAARAGLEITATSRETSIRDQAIADSIDIIFEQLNTLLVFLDAALQARAGI